MEIPQKTAWRPEAPLQIGEFAINPASNEISLNGVTTRLRPILMDVLLRLAANPGTAVSRETLLNDVWPRRMVNDEVLSRAIAELRTALGDDPKNQRYIETLPKVGYRLVAAVAMSVATSVAKATAKAKAIDKAHADAAPTVEPLLAPQPPQTAPEDSAYAAAAAHATPSPNALPSPPVFVIPTYSIWRLIRLPIIALVGLAAFGIYKKVQPPVSATTQVNLERQINAAVPFATSPQSESTPRFSPDGQSVAYARTGDAVSEIVIQDINSGKQQTFAVSDARVASPAFLSDGKSVAYWQRKTSASTPPRADDCAIAVHALEAKTALNVVDCSQRPQPVFDLSADGQTLIYSALPRAEFPLALMQLNLATKATKQLTSPGPGEGHDVYPRFSPDGKTVAFFRGTQSHMRLWTLALNDPNAKPQPASTLEGLSYGVTWNPQDGSLITAADWLSFRALNSVTLAADGNGATRRLGARGARFPDMHKNGSLVFETAAYRADLWLTNAGRPGEGAQLVWPSTRYTNQADFSPDGKRVAFASNRSGGDSIHIADLSNPAGQPTRLPLPDDARYMQPRWSADGSEVFAVQIANTGKPASQRAVRIHVASGKVDVLTHLGTLVNNAIPLSNGREVIYGELAEHAMRLYRADITGGTPKRLPLPIVSTFAIAGNDLVYTQPQLTGATRCKLDSMICTPIKVALDDSNRFDWALGNNVIWHLGRDDARKLALVRVDLTTNGRRTFDFAPTAVGTNIAVSRDGKSLLVSRESPPVVDLMIAKPLPKL